jgi:hypothetical protein
VKQLPLRASLSSSPIWVVAVGWTVYRLVTGYQIEDAFQLAVVTGVMALGEWLEVDLRGGRTTPVSTAVVFAIFVIMPPVEVILAVTVAYFIGTVVRSRQVSWEARFRSSSRRLTAVTLSLAVYLGMSTLLRPLPVDSPEQGRLLSLTLAMLLAGLLKLVVDTGVSALFISIVQKVPARPIWVGQMQNRLALHVAFLSVAALMALSHAVLGEAAFVLFLLPLVAARRSFRRYASIHKTYSQTIRGLSKVPELAEYAPQGHSVRVADIATAIARDLGFSDNEVQDVEFAALLHDVGRVSLGDPTDLPESVSGTDDGRTLAHASAGIISQTPYLDRVARIVRHQGDQFLDTGDFQPDLVLMGSRIVRTANDYVELTEQDGPGLPPEMAVEHLETRSGADYDPTIVASLGRILTHRRSL